MDYAIASDPLLLFALYGGLGVSLLTLVLVGVIALLRYLMGRDERLRQLLAERWQPVFFHAVEGVPFGPAPGFRPEDRETLLLLWINFTESIRGTARRRLRDLARELGLDAVALQFLEKGSRRLRLLAVVALGRMEAEAALAPLSSLAANPNPMLSLLAVRSLLQVDPGRGLPLLLQGVERRDDWPLARVAAMLGDLPAELLSPPLLAALRAATPAGAPRLIRLLGVVQAGEVWPLLESFLNPARPGDVLVAALKTCHDPRGREAARRLATHPEWAVRAQAATLLGRIGVAEDGLLLQAMLSDPEWWVRYRAATALAGFPGLSRTQLAELCARLSDRFAADILAHALAEKSQEAGV